MLLSYVLQICCLILLQLEDTYYVELFVAYLLLDCQPIVDLKQLEMCKQLEDTYSVRF